MLFRSKPPSHAAGSSRGAQRAAPATCRHTCRDTPHASQRLRLGVLPRAPHVQGAPCASDSTTACQDPTGATCWPLHADSQCQSGLRGLPSERKYAYMITFNIIVKTCPFWRWSVIALAQPRVCMRGGSYVQPATHNPAHHARTMLFSPGCNQHPACAEGVVFTKPPRTCKALTCPARPTVLHTLPWLRLAPPRHATAAAYRRPGAALPHDTYRMTPRNARLTGPCLPTGAP